MAMAAMDCFPDCVSSNVGRILHFLRHGLSMPLHTHSITLPTRSKVPTTRNAVLKAALEPSTGGALGGIGLGGGVGGAGGNSGGIGGPGGNGGDIGRLGVEGGKHGVSLSMV
jgi:hypothetical protein